MFEDMDLTGQTFSCLCMMFEDMDLTGQTFSCLCMTFEDMDLTGQTFSCLCMMFEDMDLTGQTFSCLCMTFEDMDLTGLTFSCLCIMFEDMDLTGQNILKSFYVYISHLWSWTWWSKTFLRLCNIWGHGPDRAEHGHCWLPSKRTSSWSLAVPVWLWFKQSVFTFM